MIFRPSEWNNWVFSNNMTRVVFRNHYGDNSDKPLSGDFNNDGVADRAVFQGGEWIIDYNMDGSVNARNRYGQMTDIPLVGDFNNDGVADRAVFRSGEWIIDYTMDGSVNTRLKFGMTGDVPMVWNL